MSEPITPQQDDSTELAEVHDRRIGRLEGIAEQTALSGRLPGKAINCGKISANYAQASAGLAELTH